MNLIFKIIIFSLLFTILEIYQANVASKLVKVKI